MMDTVFVDEKLQGVLTCTHCGATLHVHLLKMGRTSSRGDQPLRVQCACAHIVEARCDFRKFPRVTVHLHGLLRRPGLPKTVGRVTITSLSLAGVGFVVQTPLVVHSGEVLTLVFTLGQTATAVLEEDIVVRYVRDTYVGAAFRDTYPYDADLECYLLPQTP